MRAGTFAPHMGAFSSPEAIVRAARLAEELDYQTVWVAERVLYPFYGAAPRLWGLEPLADQRLGGLIMWVPAALIPLAAFTVVFFRWVAAESDEETSRV